MSQIKDLSEFNNTLIANFRLKAKILCFLFGTVLFFQICAITFVATQTNLIGKVIPRQMTLIGPSLLFLLFISELFAFRYMKRMQGNASQMRKSFIYLSTFVEVSFPVGIMFLSGSYLRNASIFPPMQIVNSPLLIIVFIMIILSSLLLNPRLSFFAGLTGGVEYFIVNMIFLNDISAGPVDYANAGIKSILLIVSGLLAGFVSRKIREAIISSHESKNELIHNLDKRVAEKTQEVVAQKTEIENKNVLLEVKQKEILDSIHYAKRIQTTLLPSEQYIARHLKK